MGDRKCAFDGCNALEFRTSGYCLRHKGGITDVKNFNVNTFREKDSSQSIPQSGWNWTMLFLTWLFPPLLLVIIPIMLLKWLFSDKEGTGQKDTGQSDNSDHALHTVSGTESSDSSDEPWWIVGGDVSEEEREIISEIKISETQKPKTDFSKFLIVLLLLVFLFSPLLDLFMDEVIFRNFNPCFPGQKCS